jgi:Stc1 domain
MAEKKCSRCGKVKPLAEFSRAAHGHGGRAAHCKDCHNTLYRLPLDRMPTLVCLYCGKEPPTRHGAALTASSAHRLARTGGGGRNTVDAARRHPRGHASGAADP